MQEIITTPGNFQPCQGFKTMFLRTVRYTLLLLNSIGRTGGFTLRFKGRTTHSKANMCMAESNSLELGSVLIFYGIQEWPRTHQPKPGLTHHNLTVSVHGTVWTCALCSRALSTLLHTAA